ncbi:hypothetical protein LCGC14_2736550, partial [marine sediment metagenome]
EELSDAEKEDWRDEAKEILSHPDLALINRGKKLPDELTQNFPLLAEILDELGWKPVTPLAKALEEK